MTETDNKLLLVSLLQESRVPKEELHKRYPAFMSNLRAACLEAPNSGCYLEVWPPAFESHAVAFGALFYQSLNATKGTTRPLMSFAGVATAVQDGCSYLQAGCFVAAAKGGVREGPMVALVKRSRETLTAQESVVLDVVEGLCKPRPTLTKDHKTALENTFGRQGEWLAGAAFAFGYLSKFIDAIVVELEQVFADISFATFAKHGWNPGAHAWKLDPNSQPRALPKPDGAFTKLKNFRFVPGTIAYTSRLQKGVPSKWSKLQPFLKARTGHDFPFMAQIQTPYMRRGLGVLLVLNLDPQTSVSGLAVKCLIGMMYATYVECDELEVAVRDMSAKFGVSEADLDKAKTFALDGELACDKFANRQIRAMLVLAKSILPTPCNVTPKVVEHLREVDVAGSVIVEVVMWMSLLVTLRRMAFYYLL